MAEETPNVARLLNRLMRMMDQQFWRWGCDVKHASGNLLVEYGFQRLPPPENLTECSSAYRLPQGGTYHRFLVRSFGAFYGHDDFGGIFVKRHDCYPYLSADATLDVVPYQESDLPLLVRADLDEARSCSLLEGLIGQIVAYETWITQAFGIGYVNQTLSARNKRPAVVAEDNLAEWRQLVQQIGELSASVIEPVS